MKLALVSLSQDKREPPLGLISIATYLKKFGNFDNIKIIDKNFDNIFEKILEIKPDLIGISAMTVHYYDAIELAKKIKTSLNIPIIIGGVHISTLPSSLKKDFDIAVIGEGEQIMLELLKLYEKGGFSKKKLKKINGLAFYDESKLVITKPIEPINPLDKIPIPDRSFLNNEYFRKIRHYDGSYGSLASMTTSRGCPFSCVFCSTSHFWKTIRFNSINHMIEEIKYLKERYNVNHIDIFDDLFTTNKTRLKEFVKAFKKEKIDGIYFSCASHAATIDEELCQLLKEINVNWLGFGFESGSEKMIKYLKKGTLKVEQSKKVIELCKKYDINVTGSLIFGSPYEKIEDMKETLKFMDFAKKYPNVLDMWSFVMTPFPGTEIWGIAKERNKVSDDMDWRLLSHQNFDNPLLLDPDVNKEEFKKIFLEGRRRLKYFKWKRITKELKRDPIWVLKQTIKKPKYAVNLLFKKTLLAESKL